MAVFDISELEADPCLAAPTDLLGRADLLDTLEIGLAGLESPPQDLRVRAEALRRQAEAIDAALAADLRAQIVAGGLAGAGLRDELRRYVGLPAPGGRAGADQYDSLDLLLGRTLGLSAPAGAMHALPAGMVPYQPTPARWLLDLADRGGLGPQDTLIDIGAGLGQPAILLALLSGARAVGIEIDPAQVAIARRAATALGLARVGFRAEDALAADLAEGTAFYLYTPLTGALLGRMLARLEREAAARPIRVWAYGPCVPAVLAQGWLRPAGQSGPITMMRSR